MAEEQQQENENENEKIPIDHPRWIGGSTLVENFEDLYDLDDLINQ